MKRTFLCIMLVFSIACKNSDKNKPFKEEKEVSKVEAKYIEKELKVSMEFKTNKEDEFIFMMNDIKIDEYQTKNIHIIEKVSPTTSKDWLMGKFDANNISNKIMISLGRKEVKEIEIFSINFEYGENSVNITPKDFKKYFGFSKFSILDTVTNKIKTVRVDNNHNPRLYVKKKLRDELNMKI